MGSITARKRDSMPINYENTGRYFCGIERANEIEARRNEAANKLRALIEEATRSGDTYSYNLSVSTESIAAALSLFELATIELRECLDEVNSLAASLGRDRVAILRSGGN